MTFQSYLKSMDDYIDKLKTEIKANPCESKEKAVKSLIASGVFNEDGTPKSRICDAEQQTTDVTKAIFDNSNK